MGIHHPRLGENRKHPITNQGRATSPQTLYTMNTIDQIRAEIERRKTKLHSTIFNDEYNDLLSFLDTLQEQPVDLDKEIDDFYEMNRDENGIAHDKDNGEIVCDWKTGGRETFIRLFARHFHELGRQSKPEVSEGLEEAAKAYAYGESDDKYQGFVDGASWQKEQDEREKHRQEWIAENDRNYLKLDSYEYIIKCALDGVTRLGSLCDDDAILDASRLCAKHIKEQMMKEAVEGVVYHYVNVHYIVTDQKQLNDRLKVFDQDTKVRIIIVKED